MTSRRGKVEVIILAPRIHPNQLRHFAWFCVANCGWAGIITCLDKQVTKCPLCRGAVDYIRPPAGDAEAPKTLRSTPRQETQRGRRAEVLAEFREEGARWR